MVCLPLAGLNHGAASDRWPTWGQASLPRSGFVQVPSLAIRGCEVAPPLRISLTADYSQFDIAI